MNEEIKNLIVKETFVVVERPKGVTVLGTKWVLKIKKNCDGSIERFKEGWWQRVFVSLMGSTIVRPTHQSLRRKLSVYCLP